MKEFAEHLKYWRGLRRLSQLNLAMDADISARHISFLETGRSRPSRHMVLHLAGILEVPGAARNDMLNAAGFASIYTPLRLEDDNATIIVAAIEHMIRNHDPYPASVIDRLWKLKMLNHCASAMLARSGLGVGDSLLDFLTAPDGARTHIVNWAEIGRQTVQRLQTKSRVAGGIAELDAAAAQLLADPTIRNWRPQGPMAPVMSTVYQMGKPRITMFSTYTPIGATTEPTLTELTVELMFPADDISARMIADFSKPVGRAPLDDDT